MWKMCNDFHLQTSFACSINTSKMQKMCFFASNLNSGSSHAGLFLFTNEEQRKAGLCCCDTYMYKFNTFATQLAFYDQYQYQYRTSGKHHHCKKENTHPKILMMPINL